MTFAIIKDAPPPSGRRGGRRAYNFADMEVGDAFDAPRDMGKDARGADKRQGTVSCCAANYATRHNPGAKFVTRLIDEHTVRCWRIA